MPDSTLEQSASNLRCPQPSTPLAHAKGEFTHPIQAFLGQALMKLEVRKWLFLSRAWRQQHNVANAKCAAMPPVHNDNQRVDGKIWILSNLLKKHLEGTRKYRNAGHRYSGSHSNCSCVSTPSTAIFMSKPHSVPGRPSFPSSCLRAQAPLE